MSSYNPSVEQADLSVQKTYDPLSNKEILGISEKILKKNFNLGEEGYDIARDEGRVKPSKPVKKPKPMSVMSSYNPLYNKEILGISEKILKKNFNLGEEGYDIARDEGRVKPAKDKKDGTSYPPSEEMKKTQKVNKGPSAYERVKKRYGKSVMNLDKKKKDEK